MCVFALGICQFEGRIVLEEELTRGSHGGVVDEGLEFAFGGGLIAGLGRHAMVVVFDVGYCHYQVCAKYNSYEGRRSKDIKS